MVCVWLRPVLCAAVGLVLAAFTASAEPLPAGVQALGSPTSVSIPPTGAVASFADGSLVVQAFADPSRARLTLQYQAVDARTLPAAQSGLSLGFGAFQLSATDAPSVNSYNIPFNLVVTPGDSDLSLALGRLERLYLATWNGNIWLGVPCSPDAVTGAHLVCSVTQLGLFVPLIALPANPALTNIDAALANGHFYTQGNGFDGGGGLGYSVVDDDDAQLWSAFQREGGVPRLGYPVSQRFQNAGLVTQVFQRGALQWVPEIGGAQLLHIMTVLHARGADEWLDKTHRIPPTTDGTPADSSILSPFPSIVSAYASDPDLYGAPVSIKTYGELVTARFQQSTLPTFASTGDVMSGTPGELARAAGVVPAADAVPAPM